MLAFEEGFGLRSRYVLVSQDDLRFELLYGGGQGGREFSLDRVLALGLVTAARDSGARHGLTWQEDEILLQPAERLVDLVRRSRVLVASGETE